MRQCMQAINTKTGETYSGLTGSEGSYTLPLIKPGEYELIITGDGFKHYRRSGITLETGLTARVDVQLEVGAVSDSITVRAEAPLLSSETSSVGSVVRNSTIANMPLVGRRAAQLVRLN